MERPWKAFVKHTISILSFENCLPHFRANFNAPSLASVPELAKKKLSGPGSTTILGGFDHSLGELSSIVVVVQVTGMNKCVGLIINHFSYLSIRVSKSCDGNTGCKIEIFSVLSVVQVTSLAVRNNNVWACIGCHCILLVFFDGI